MNRRRLQDEDDDIGEGYEWWIVHGFVGYSSLANQDEADHGC